MNLNCYRALACILFVFLPVQLNPSPTNPCLQWQLYDPLVSLQKAYLSQRLDCPSSHLLTSVKRLIVTKLTYHQRQKKNSANGFSSSFQLHQIKHAKSSHLRCIEKKKKYIYIYIYLSIYIIVLMKQWYRWRSEVSNCRRKKAPLVKSICGL